MGPTPPWVGSGRYGWKPQRPVRSISERREVRRLSSARAGTTSQRFASERFDRYVRSNLLTIAIVLMLNIALSAGVWFICARWREVRWLAAGLVAGAGLMALYHWCVLFSGSGAATMGSVAEGWTDLELRRLHRKGWRHVNGVVIKAGLGDIDHVAVGPDGVIVVETKWRSHEEDVDDLSGWMAGAIRQAQRNRKQVVQLLNWQRRDPLLVQALIVLWGPDIVHESAEAVLADGVNVTAGDNLADDLAALGDVRLSDAEVDEVFAKLRKRIVDRHAWELANLPPREPTLGERAARWLVGALMFGVGLPAALFTVGLGWWAIPAVGALTGAGLRARRLPEFRVPASGFLCGVAAGVALIGVAALTALWL